VNSMVVASDCCDISVVVIGLDRMDVSLIEIPGVAVVCDVSGVDWFSEASKEAMEGGEVFSRGLWDRRTFLVSDKEFEKEVKAALRGGYGVMRRYQVVVKTLVESR